MFTSVDPLVTMTMQPYLYGAANPATYSDPSGLCPDAGCWEMLGPVMRELAGIDPPGTVAARQLELNAAVSDSILENYGSYFESGNAMYSQRDLHYAQDLNCVQAGLCDPQALTWRAFVGLGKNLVVGGLAVGAGAVFCGSTGGLGCVVLVGAAAGAGSNMALSEVEDCVQGSSCGEFSVRESLGDAVDGALVGGSGGASGGGMALALGANRATAGVLTSPFRYGAAETLEALVTIGSVRTYMTAIRFYIAGAIDYLRDQGSW